MSITAPKMTVDEFAAYAASHGRCEPVNGEVRDMTPAGFKHGLPLVLLMALAVASCSGEDGSTQAKVDDINQRISVGMDVDVAVEALRDAGYHVGDKYHPTAAKDYYLVNVVVNSERSAADTARYTAGMKTRGKTYVVIEAGNDGRIVSIE